MAYPVDVASGRKYPGPDDRSKQLARIRRGNYSTPPYPGLDPEIQEIYEQLNAERVEEGTGHSYGYAIALLIAATVVVVAILLYTDGLGEDILL